MGGSEERFNVDEVLRPAEVRRLRRLPALIWQALVLVRRAAPRPLAVTTLFQAVSAVGTAVQLLVGKLLLDQLLEGNGATFGQILPDVVLLSAVTAVVSFADLARAEQQRVLSELVARYTMDQVLGVSTAVELTDYDRPEFYNRLQRAAANAAVRPPQMISGLLAVVGALLTIASIAAALLVLQPGFFLLVLLTYVPVYVVSARASRAIYDFSVQQTEADRERMYLFTVLARREEAGEVRAFGLATYFRERYRALHDARIENLRVVVRRRFRLGMAGGTINAVLSAGVLGLLVWFVTDGRMSLAAAGAAAGAIVLLGQRLRALASGTAQLYENALYLEDFTSFVNAAPSPRAVPPVVEAAADFEVVTVDDVSFTYPARTAPAVDRVSLELRKGEVVALVGENGSGKTTLAKLIAGLYEPSAGSILWDGVDVTDRPQPERAAGVAVIFQDYAKYMLAAWENIAVGRPELASDGPRVREAAERSRADSFISELHAGYDTRLGAQFFGGSELSGGQWQRVALARAFFRDAPLLILDEPTASLDPRAEYELFDRMRLLYRGRSVLLISHRYASVRHADRIYVMSDGRVVEDGTHDDLMKQDGLYAELFRMQASTYLDLT